MKLRTRMGVALGAACAVAGLGALYADLVTPRRPEHASAPTSHRPAASRVETQPNGAPLFHASTRPSSRPVAAPESASSASETPAEAPPALPELAKNLTEPLKARWQQEPKDAKWAGLERDIATFFNDPRLSGITFVSADCRTTLCRYEVALNEADALRNMLDIAQVAGPFAGAVGVPALDGDRLTVFLAPPGVPLFSKPIQPELMERVRKHFRIAPS